MKMPLEKSAIFKETEYILNGIITARKISPPDKEWKIIKLPNIISVMQEYETPYNTGIKKSMSIFMIEFICLDAGWEKYRIIVDQRVLGRGQLKDISQFSKYSYREVEGFNRLENPEYRKIEYTFYKKEDLLKFLNLLIVLV